MTPNIASDDARGKALVRAGPCTRLSSRGREIDCHRDVWPHRVFPMASSARALTGEFGAFPSRQGPRGRVPSWRLTEVLFLTYPSLVDANIYLDARMNMLAPIRAHARVEERLTSLFLRAQPRGTWEITEQKFLNGRDTSTSTSIPQKYWSGGAEPIEELCTRRISSCSGYLGVFGYNVIRQIACLIGLLLVALPPKAADQKHTICVSDWGHTCSRASDVFMHCRSPNFDS
jgi:hypothetical protein